MQNFELSDELKMIKDTIKKFCNKEVVPVAAVLDQSPEFQEEIFIKIFSKLAELGFLGLLIPEDYGGSGADFMSVALVLEELGRVSPGIAFSYLAHTPVMAYSNIYVNGTENQKKKYLEPMCRGEIIGANAITEPDAGSDLYNIKTTAIQKGDHFIINGSKTFITNARVAEVFYVLAKDKSAENKFSGFLVDKNSDGITVGRDLDKCGYRASPTSEVFFQDCKIPKENLLGERGKGLELSLSEIELQRIYLAFIAVGLAEAALDASIKYAKERIQFGRPIADYQMIQAQIAEMYVEYEAARLLVWKAAYEKDQGERNTLSTSVAKYYGAEAAVSAANTAMKIFGSYGYSSEYPAERYFRDAKSLQVVEGTSNIQKIIISRNVIK